MSNLEVAQGTSESLIPNGPDKKLRVKTDAESPVSPPKISPTRPAFKRLPHYSTSRPSTPETNLSLDPLTSTITTRHRRSFSDAPPRKSSWVESDTLNGFPGFIAPPRRQIGDNRKWNYQLIRQLHHRRSPIGFHIRQLSLQDKRRIARETAEELQVALHSINQHEYCRPGYRCGHKYRGRKHTEKREWIYPSDEEEDPEDAKTFESIELAVRAIEGAGKLIHGVREDVLSPPETENTTPTQPSGPEATLDCTLSGTETPAWVMTPALSLGTPPPDETPCGNPLESPQTAILPRPRARTLDSQPLLISNANSPSPGREHTLGILAMKQLQGFYRASGVPWVFGGADGPVEVWVENWGLAGPRDREEEVEKGKGELVEAMAVKGCEGAVVSEVVADLAVAVVVPVLGEKKVVPSNVEFLEGVGVEVSDGVLLTD